MLIHDFMVQEYIPHTGATLARSTVDGYRKMWRTYSPYLVDKHLEMKVFECQSILRKLAADNPQLNKTSLKHIKHFFCGVLAHALRVGLAETNPWRAVSIPSAAEPSDTYAYTPSEVNEMLSATSGATRLVIFTAAATGLRKSELAGLQWGDWDATTSTLSVNRAKWRGTLKTTKSKASKAPVPVIPALSVALESAFSTVKSSACGAARQVETAIFSMDLDNLARRVIVPALAGTAIKWHGWHALRRGLATTLHSAGIPDMEIQKILRHSHISVTQACYIRTVPENIRKAMSAVNFGGD